MGSGREDLNLGWLCADASCRRLRKGGFKSGCASAQSYHMHASPHPIGLAFLRYASVRPPSDCSVVRLVLPCPSLLKPSSSSSAKIVSWRLHGFPPDEWMYRGCARTRVGSSLACLAVIFQEVCPPMNIHRFSVSLYCTTVECNGSYIID